MVYLIFRLSLRVAVSLVCPVLLVLNLSQASIFAQGEVRGDRDERRREWRSGGSDGGGRREGRGGDRRSGWNPEEFLKRLDANGDGRLETTEMSGRTQRYLSELGFDTSKAIDLAVVAEKIRVDRGENTEATKKDNEVEGKVPGFGASNEKVPGFSSSLDEEDLSEYGEEIIRQVDWVIDNYDKNKNKVLDKVEHADIPAGPPPLSESDTNRDGKISKLELANRYRARAQYSRRTEGENRNSLRGSNSRNDERSNRNASRGRFAAEPSSVASRSRSSRSSGSRSADPSPDRTQKDRVVDSSQVDRTTKYVENIISKYDTDRDGKLSTAELQASGIRNPPKADEEGFVTREAYVNFLINPKPTPESSSNAGNVEATPSDSGSERPSRGYRGGSRKDKNNSSSSNSGSKPSRKVTFDDYDQNGNGMIEMHEYSQEWDDAILEQFYQKDKNRDGVITGKEWKGF